MKKIDSLKSWSILICAWIFYFYEYILRVSTSVMTHELMHDFHITASALGVLVAFYYFAYVPLQIPCGIIVDRFGARKVITASAFLCSLGAFLFAQSEHLMSAQLGRFLMGVGSACACLSCSKVASEWFSPSKFAIIAGMTQLIGNLGGCFGSKPFAMLVNHSGWRESMMIFAGVGIIVMGICWLFMEKSSASHSQNSLYDGLKIIATNKQSWLIAFYGCMMYLPLTAFAELWGAPFLMQRYGISNEIASMGNIMLFVGMGLGCIGGAYLSSILKSRKKVMGGAALGTLLCFLGVLYISSLSLNMVFLLLFVGGFISGGQILYFAAIKEVNPSHIAGTSIGFANFGVMASGLVFQPLLGFLLDLTWNGKMGEQGTRMYEEIHYQIAFSSVCVALLVGFLSVYFMKESYTE
jgi:sugar phosphate permease